MIFTCKKCGSTNYRIGTKGTQNGLYCSQCGFWHKWIAKDETYKYEATVKPQCGLPDELVINGITYRRCNMNCPNCGSKLDTGFNCPICGYSPEKQLVAVPKPEPSIAENEEEEEENE